VNLRLWRTSNAYLTFKTEDDPFTPWHGCPQPQDPDKPRLALEPVWGWDLTKVLRLPEVVGCVKECQYSLSEHGLLDYICHDFCVEFLQTLGDKGIIVGTGEGEWVLARGRMT